MKKILLIGTMLLMGCPTVPTPTPKPTPAPSVVPSAQPSSELPAPEPVHQVINWVPFTQELHERLERDNLCVMVYFGGACGAPCAYVEKEYFGSSEFSQTINDAFVATRFPADRFKDLLPDMGVDQIPSFGFASTYKSNQSLMVTGLTTPEKMISTIKEFPFYEECVESQSK